MKAIEEVLPIHKSQLLTYLRVANKRVGLLINFNVQALKNGISRIVNEYTGPALPPTPRDLRVLRVSALNRKAH